MHESVQNTHCVLNEFGKLSRRGYYARINKTFGLWARSFVWKARFIREHAWFY